MSQTQSSAFNRYLAQLSPRSSINMAHWSFSSLIDIATAATSTQGGAQGGAEFVTFIADVKDATGVLGCQWVQQEPDCSVVVNPQQGQQQQQQQQDLPLTVSVNPPSINPPSLQAVSPALHQDGSISSTPTLWTPNTTLHTPTLHDEGEGGKK